MRIDSPSSSARSDRCIVVGGGVIGCGVAWELARRGRDVTVVERDRPGRGASWAAAGMLSPLAEAERPGPFLELGLASLDLFPEFAARLRDATGIDVEYRRTGKLRLAFTEAEEQRLAETHQWYSAQGFEAEWLDGDAVRRLEPELAPGIRGALRVALDHQVDNRMLARALWLAAEAAGARVVNAASVRTLMTGPAPQETRASARVTGVELATGEVIEATSVVLAAGCWSGLVAGLPRPIPVHPVPGQMLALGPAARRYRHMLMTERCYIVPRSDGRVLVGATVEAPSFLAFPSAAGVHRLLSGALEVSPFLAHLPIAETWAGLRPGTPDGLPILGEDPDVAGLYYATGHYRNGILLAPITAHAIADLVCAGESSVPLAAFRPERFESVASSGETTAHATAGDAHA